jgi:hypothetical protein
MSTYLPTSVDSVSDNHHADAEEEPGKPDRTTRRMSPKSSVTVPSGTGEDAPQTNWIVLPAKIGGKRPKKEDVGYDTSSL